MLKTASLHDAHHDYWLAVPTFGVNYSKHGLLTPRLLQSIVQSKDYQKVADERYTLCLYCICIVLNIMTYRSQRHTKHDKCR